MIGKRLLGLVLVGLLLVQAFVTTRVVSAASIAYPIPGTTATLTLTTPDTYSLCSGGQDTISITGMPADGSLTLIGWVSVQYVLEGGGRQVVPGGDFSINQTKDLSLQVTYPPIDQWPVMSNATAEIHVDLAIEVYYLGIEKLATLGPGQDWDVFCLGRPTPPPPPPPAEGCTPGYWKQDQHLAAWGPTGYAPNQTLEDVFDVPDSLGLDATALQQALSLDGGPGTSGGARILLRAAVAALLNSAQPEVDYPLATSDVISSVNAALASGSRDTMLGLATTLDQDNNLGCPLN